MGSGSSGRAKRLALRAEGEMVDVTNAATNEVPVVDLVDRTVTATMSLGDAGYSPGEIVGQPRPIAREPVR